MNIKKLLLSAICAGAIAAPLSAGKIGLFVDIGQSKDKIDIYRVGLRYNFSDWLHNKGAPEAMGGYLEGSFNYWHGKKDNLWGVALSPVFYYEFNHTGRIRPYIEGGIGGAYISKTRIDNRNMSSNLHFEDRIGIGVRTGDLDFHFRYMHYSNAGLKKPNDGIDIFIGGVAYKF